MDGRTVWWLVDWNSGSPYSKSSCGPAVLIMITTNNLFSDSHSLSGSWRNHLIFLRNCQLSTSHIFEDFCVWTFGLLFSDLLLTSKSFSDPGTCTMLQVHVTMAQYIGFWHIPSSYVTYPWNGGVWESLRMTCWDRVIKLGEDNGAAASTQILGNITHKSLPIYYDQIHRAERRSILG